MKAQAPTTAGCVTMAEIATALSVSRQGVAKRAEREAWPFVAVAGRGGNNRQYTISTLPIPVRELVQLHQAGADATPATLPAVVAKTLPIVRPVQVDQPLKTKQLDAEIARERLFGFIADFDGTEARAIECLNAGDHAQSLPGPLSWAMANAWGKRRANVRLTRSTLAKWKEAKTQRGRCAPLVRQKDMTAKPWHALAVDLKKRPQGSLLTWIVEQIEAGWNNAWGKPPSYDTVRHFFADKFSQIDQLKGRHTGSALSPFKHYTQRTSAGMQPWDEVHADGWNTHFTAPHPVTGEYVTYEVWHAHDVATRYVPPFGLGITENFEVIAKCVENAVRFGGCMAILQTDSTKIVKNSERFKTNPATALADRVGFTVVHPKTVGNSQANGIAENFNSWLDKECRELATYQGKGMDSMVLKRVKKLTAKAVRQNKAGDHDGFAVALNEAERMGKGRVFRTHDEACDWLESRRVKWNAKPHSSLPKVRDEATGRSRHQSPDEALQLARDNGWTPYEFEEEYVVHLFRMHKQVTVRREAVTPYGGMRYHDACLGDWNGKDVVVAYDNMDWKQVWVKTLKGELICVAKFSEATGYRTATAKEEANEKRANAQIKHRERQIDAIRERAGLDAIDGECIHMQEVPELTSVPRLTDEEMAAIEQRQQKPKAMSYMEMQMWLNEEVPAVVAEKKDVAQDRTGVEANEIGDPVRELATA
ncbi:Mu transposase C-terminal domain-containing protein [Propionivibrio sp.]|uniref:Mu transposase C-terminal domain-containing protein n=1 Tax=Propionivibrio sp. TaxID=2212460 RepID=UPI003BF34113